MFLCVRVDIIPNLLLEARIKRIFKETKCLKANIRISFKYMDNGISSKLFMLYVHKAKTRYFSSLVTTLKHKELIEKVQRRTTKMLPELGKLSYRERLDALYLPTLNEKRLMSDLVLTFEFLKEVDEIDCGQFFGRCRIDQPEGIT